MRTVIKKLLNHKLETLFFMVVLGFVGYRLAPQVGAALGIGAANIEINAGTFETLEGHLISMESLKGQVVLINDWATWCPPCVLEMPGFQRVYDEFRDQGFMVIGISHDQDSPDLLRTFLQQKEITYPIAMAGQASLQEFDVGSLPTSFLIGRDGLIKHRVVGIFAEHTLKRAVSLLLEEAEPAPLDPSS